MSKKYKNSLLGGKATILSEVTYCYIAILGYVDICVGSQSDLQYPPPPKKKGAEGSGIAVRITLVKCR
jgi:hypothetical protein